MPQRRFTIPPLPTALLLLVVAACADDAPPPGPDALSTVLTPKRPASYYVAQANKYFDTLDTSADPNSVPDYSPLVARWEWPPWLYLTGFKKDLMIASTKVARAADPSTVPTRDCKALATQPFARCHVVFRYAEGDCPIYEEFTFNDQGQMTFIEAWSVQPGMLPIKDATTDRWAEGAGVKRLSTRVPGLGNARGLIDLDAQWMKDDAKKDKDLANFVNRARDFWTAWFQAYSEAGPELYRKGCGWK